MIARTLVLIVPVVLLQCSTDTFGADASTDAAPETGPPCAFTGNPVTPCSGCFSPNTCCVPPDGGPACIPGGACAPSSPGFACLRSGDCPGAVCCLTGAAVDTAVCPHTMVSTSSIRSDCALAYVCTNNKGLAVCTSDAECNGVPGSCQKATLYGGAASIGVCL